MKERPILFSAPMVRAILAGHKTQTRRVVKFPRSRDSFVMIDYGKGWWPYQSDDGETEVCNDSCEHPYSSPYGQPGDRLWVKETWRHTASSLEEARAITEDIASGIAVDWRATYIKKCMQQLGFTQEDAEMADDFETWRPSIFMPRWASRILLEVVSVRVERLNDISEADAVAEGIIQQKTTGWFSVPGINGAGTTARAAYALLWNSINGASWNKNPWVWVVEFKQIQPTKGRDGE